MVKSAEGQTTPPPKALYDAMGQLAQDAAKAGCVMVDTGGLLPTATGARVSLADGKVTVMDGPFTEAKEIVGGYAIFDAKSKDDILEWTRRFMELHKQHYAGWEGETEIRQLMTAEQQAEICGRSN